MFGTRIAKRFVYAVLSGEAAVAAVVGARLYPLRNVPQEGAYPAGFYYPEDAPYAGPIVSSGLPDAQRVRMVVRFADGGYDDAAILPAAEAAFLALHGAEADIDGFHVTAAATGEWPLTDYVDAVEGAAVPTVELGLILEVDVMSTG